METKQVIRKNKYIELINRLINKGLSRNQILEQLDWSTRKLTTFMYRHHLKLSRYSNIFPTDEQTQVIIGSLLGDGCISYSGKYSKNCRLQISHCMGQLEYLEYKYSVLKNLCKSGIKIRERKDKRFKIETYNQCEIKTKSLKVFSNYRDRWYPKGIKTLEISNIYDLGPLGIAIWFMDDGTKTGNTVSFACQSFSKQDLLFLQYLLLNRFKLQTTLHKDNTLRIRQKSYNGFINLIKPFMINSMLYKIASTKSDKLLGTLEVDNQQPI